MHKDFNDYNEIFILYAIYDLDLIILKELAVVKCGEMCHMYIYVLYSMMTALKNKTDYYYYIIVFTFLTQYFFPISQFL